MPIWGYVVLAPWVILIATLVRDAFLTRKTNRALQQEIDDFEESRRYLQEKKQRIQPPRRRRGEYGYQRKIK